MQSATVRWLALFWGFAVFFPVGVNYAALGALMLAMAFAGDFRARVARVRAEPNGWPAALLLAWGAAVLALGPHYPETASNAAHGFRIVLTLWVALALSHEEARSALAGFAAGVLACLALIGLDSVWPLPPLDLWNGIVHYGGNKSLANATLLALAGAALLLAMPQLPARRRWAAAALVLALVAVLLDVLYSRTAWLILLAGLVAGALHQLRARGRRQAALLAILVAAALAAGAALPAVRARLALGADEIASAYQGERVSETSSWGIRFRMYGETLDMIRQRPLVGWGVGGWTTEWRKRVDGPLAAVNMPHNDLLWMGAQTGIPGALLLLATITAGLPRAWRRHDLSGRMGVLAILAMLLAVLTNSALRDASIGLSLWFVVLVFQRLSTAPPAVWLAPFGGWPRRAPAA